jgi:hypothetical protein
VRRLPDRRIRDEFLELLRIDGDSERRFEVEGEIEGSSCSVAEGEEVRRRRRRRRRKGGSKVDGEEGVDEEGEVVEIFGSRNEVLRSVCPVEDDSEGLGDDETGEDLALESELFLLGSFDGLVMKDVLESAQGRKSEMKDAQEDSPRDISPARI